MGTVYLVLHIQLKKKFAAKILHADTKRKPDSLARFEQEAVSASRLDHDNIVNIVNFGRTENGTPYIIMEYLRGRTLNQVLTKERLSIADVGRIAVAICRALSAAHQAGIVHRDLKPENIFVSRQIKLLDFGVSKMKEAHFEDRHITQTGDVLGSPLYMSPEASRGATDINASADIYAMGVMLYEMCTGRVPFLAENYLQVLYAHISEAPLPPRELVPELPEGLEQVILCALAKEPAARFPTIDLFEASIRAALPGIDLDGKLDLATGEARISAPFPVQPDPQRDSAARSSKDLPTLPRPVSTLDRNRARRRAAMMAIALGAVVTLVAAVGIGFLLARRTPSADSPAATKRPPATLSSSSAPLAVDDENTVELVVDSSPRGATVTLDGIPIGKTPLSPDVPFDPSDKEHVVKVKLSGYQAETRLIKLDRNRAVAVSLQPKGKGAGSDAEDGQAH
jgi:serine/threonine-protein kinase